MKAYLGGLISTLKMNKYTLFLLFFLGIPSYNWTSACSLTAQTETVNYRNWSIGSDEREDKIALVIGNSLYSESDSLPGAAQDAEKMAEALNAQGYDVEIGYNLDRDSLEAAVKDFAYRFRDYEEGIVFYAGHGIRVNGENYLLPIGADFERPEQVRDACYHIDRIFDLINDPEKPKLVIMDACRDNPFNKPQFQDTKFRMTFSKVSVRNLRNASIVYSTAKTTTVSDDNPFVEEFTKQVKRGGCIEDILVEVSKAVETHNPYQLVSREGILYRQVCFGHVATETAGGRADTDGDGVTDDVDACARAVGPIACNGCPMVNTSSWRERMDEIVGGEATLFLFGQEMERLQRIDNGPAKARLGYLLRTGRGSAPDDARAQALFLEAVETDGFAEYNLGYLAETGALGAPDPVKAISFYRRGAELGDPYAAYNLAIYLLNKGRANMDDINAALKYLKQAAARGIAEADVRIGELYSNNSFARRRRSALENEELSYEHFQRAARSNHPGGLMALGMMEEKKVQSNTESASFDEAEAMYREAVRMEHPPAMVRLGVLLCSGKTTSEREEEAARLFLRAAELGDINGMHEIGNAYHLGVGVKKDRRKALGYHQQAATAGHPGSKKYLKNWERKKHRSDGYE